MKLGLDYAVYSRTGPPLMCYRGNWGLEAMFLNESDAEAWIRLRPTVHGVTYQVFLSLEGWKYAEEQARLAEHYSVRNLHKDMITKYKDWHLNGPASRYREPTI